MQKPYKVRVAYEYKNLKINIEKLEKFVEKPYSGINQMLLSLMKLQLKTMKDYLSILEKRAKMDSIDLNDFVAEEKKK